MGTDPQSGILLGPHGVESTLFVELNLAGFIKSGFTYYSGVYDDNRI